MKNSPDTVTVKPGETVTLTWVTDDGAQDFVNDTSCMDISLSFRGQDYTLTVSNNDDYQNMEIYDDEDDSDDWD